MDEAQATILCEGDGSEARLRVRGALTLPALARARAALRGALARPALRAVEFDLAALEGLDTAGAWLIVSERARLERAGVATRLTPPPARLRELLEAVAAAMPEAPPPPPRQGLAQRLAALGRGVESGALGALDALAFLGLTLARLGGALLRPRRLRMAALFSHMQQAGLNAVPIVTLMGFLIGVVLAFQGATQLRRFGAEVFVVDLIAISALRELGALLTAIIVAGRSGSAFTAAIGSMKVNEEIDAMRALSLDPIETLALPRALALLLTLPVLSFLAMIAALAGGLLMSWIELGVSPGMFLERLHAQTDVKHFLVGISKAPVFALIIGVVGCHQGFLVGGSAESVGRRTTASVVIAIFSVIVADALFSVFFAELGI
ncbi:ABC transporter permease [Oceanicella actignis]|uniref:Phospholipid/cholesterol/gamma-HCH transport system permease protein n=1 Tax=Oceanicella actignis TaxID=1189325 RepID=A0A1M7SH84_9RHOB|nr:ABC transporter permease [Oceanicella actignis]SET19917.1 phospholipid/cholesterol/gamma-HCH transport system permease protein [Oceanicella actignis]SHN57836.1 phospholipid/cholesterol/gamma-HCH transport system permease protein [Oceanicella actignis]